MGTDSEAIEQTVQLYIDGVATGDADKLKRAFHDDARMFGFLGQRYDVPIGEMIEMIVAQPADTGSYKGTIADVRQTGDAAIVEVTEEGFWGTLSFVDYFSLAKFDATWKIVNKVFAHTGGEMPQA
jgi:uncharacterized protein (TIGR02246 family)